MILILISVATALVVLFFEISLPLNVQRFRCLPGAFISNQVLSFPFRAFTFHQTLITLVSNQTTQSNNRKTLLHYHRKSFGEGPVCGFILLFCLVY